MFLHSQRASLFQIFTMGIKSILSSQEVYSSRSFNKSYTSKGLLQ